jgi:hypothetical protein
METVGEVVTKGDEKGEGRGSFANSSRMIVGQHNVDSNCVSRILWNHCWAKKEKEDQRNHGRIWNLKDISGGPIGSHHISEIDWSCLGTYDWLREIAAQWQERMKQIAKLGLKFQPVAGEVYYYCNSRWWNSTYGNKKGRSSGSYDYPRITGLIPWQREQRREPNGVNCCQMREPLHSMNWVGTIGNSRSDDFVANNDHRLEKTIIANDDDGSWR